MSLYRSPRTGGSVECIGVRGAVSPGGSARAAPSHRLRISYPNSQDALSGVVIVWMAFFVTMSLSISAIVNYYNRKMMLVER